MADTKLRTEQIEDLVLANITDVTATAAEVNILDGVTSTTAELNILDGVTATAAELNALDGITATVTELNHTDGVTSNIQTQLDAKLASSAYDDATAAETTTGTSTTKYVSPDGLAGSDYGKRIIEAQIVEGATDVATGDGAGNFRFFVPEEMNGWNLVGAHAAVVTAGTTGTTDVQVHNVTQTADMLSTKITIDSTEKTSYTAATAPVVDGTNDDVATGDELRVDVDAVSTTAPKGLSIILVFQLP